MGGTIAWARRVVLVGSVRILTHYIEALNLHTGALSRLARWRIKTKSSFGRSNGQIPHGEMILYSTGASRTALAASCHPSVNDSVETE